MSLGEEDWRSTHWIPRDHEMALVVPIRSCLTATTRSTVYTDHDAHVLAVFVMFARPCRNHFYFFLTSRWY
jgi:hypothetical protein